jgi:TP901 family phage tail tape measure protein
MGKVVDATLRFVDRFTAPMNNAIKTMERSAKKSQRMGKDIQKAGRRISDMGASFTKKLTVSIVDAGAASLKMSSDFENSMAKVATIADTTKVPISNLKQQVLDLSNKTGVGATDIAEAQYQAISAGVDTAASVNFVKTAIKAAKGGFTDTTTAVDGLTTVLNAYGKKAGEASKISDQMMVAQNFGKTTFGAMASSMGNVIPIASSLNVSTEELFSSVAVLTKNGIGTSEAVTGLKAAYSNILKPTADASKTAEKLGLNFSAAHLKSVGWSKFLGEIKEKTKGNTTTMAKLFGSTEALNSVTVLAGKGSKDFSGAMKKMEKSTGATQKAYKKMLTPSEKMNISINKIKNNSIKVGTALTPVFEKVAFKISDIGDKFGNLSDSQVDTIVKFAGIIALVGSCLIVIGKLKTGIGSVVKSTKKIVKVYKGATKAVKAIKSAFSFERLQMIKNVAIKVKDKAATIAMTIASKAAAVGTWAMTAAQKALNFAFVSTPIGWIVLGIGAVIAIGVLLVKNWGKIKKAAGKLWEGIKSVFSGIGDWFAGIWGGIKAGFKAFINFIIGGLNKIPEGLNSLQVSVPKWVPGVGGKTLGFNVPTIPYLAHGTGYWQGGTAMIHDKGAEVVDLPRGSRVYPHDKSIQMAKQEGQGHGNITINIFKLADNVEIRSDKDIDEVAEKTAEKLANKLWKIRNNQGRTVLA